MGHRALSETNFGDPTVAAFSEYSSSIRFEFLVIFLFINLLLVN